MKIILTAVVIVILATVVKAFAYEIKGNPDRFPSMEFTYSNQELNAKYDAQISNTKVDARELVNSMDFLFLFPADHFLTFKFGGSYTSEMFNFTQRKYHNDWQVSGFKFSAGLKIYFK